MTKPAPLNDQSVVTPFGRIRWQRRKIGKLYANGTPLISREIPAPVENHTTV